MELNVIVGILIIILNAFPLIFKKPRYIVLIGAISLFILLMLSFIEKP